MSSNENHFYFSHLNFLSTSDLSKKIRKWNQFQQNLFEKEFLVEFWNNIIEFRRLWSLLWWFSPMLGLFNIVIFFIKGAETEVSQYWFNHDQFPRTISINFTWIKIFLTCIKSWMFLKRALEIELFQENFKSFNEQDLCFIELGFFHFILSTFSLH